MNLIIKPNFFSVNLVASDQCFFFYLLCIFFLPTCIYVCRNFKDKFSLVPVWRHRLSGCLVFWRFPALFLVNHIFVECIGIVHAGGALEVQLFFLEFTLTALHFQNVFTVIVEQKEKFPFTMGIENGNSSTSVIPNTRV